MLEPATVGRWSVHASGTARRSATIVSIPGIPCIIRVMETDRVAWTDRKLPRVAAIAIPRGVPWIVALSTPT
jgi:hypothetical protein